MSRPAHVQDFCLLCWFSQLSAILDLGNQADFWQQTSVYSTFFSEFLLVYLITFFDQFHFSYRREIMISEDPKIVMQVIWNRRFTKSYVFGGLVQPY